MCCVLPTKRIHQNQSDKEIKTFTDLSLTYTDSDVTFGSYKLPTTVRKPPSRPQKVKDY